jgi:hypothetical protein
MEPSLAKQSADSRDVIAARPIASFGRSRIDKLGGTLAGKSMLSRLEHASKIVW